MSKEQCLYCAGTGRTKDNPMECKHCGAQFKMKSYTDLKGTKIFVPTKYRDSQWSSEGMEKYVKSFYGKQESDARVNEAINNIVVLNKIVELVTEGKTIKGTVFITSPVQLLTNKQSFGDKELHDIEKWSYTVMVNAEKAERNVLPVIDMVDTNLELNAEDILTVDILTIKVNNYKLKETVEKLNYLIPKRDAKDLMTIIITTIPFSVITGNTDYMSFMPDLMIEFPNTMNINGGRY